MKYIIFLFAFLQTAGAFSQDTGNPLTKTIIVKTNLLSLIAKRPTVSIEKLFSNTFSMEVSFVQGQFKKILFTDLYDYNGFLLRAKKHFTKLDYGQVSPYAALYIGNLKRNIQTTGGQIGSGGLIGYPYRNFSANSVRGGGSLGLSYTSKNRIIVDGSMSFGYGAYTKIYKPDVNRHSNGYLDAQVWLSIGYCF